MWVCLCPLKWKQGQFRSANELLPFPQQALLPLVPSKTNQGFGLGEAISCCLTCPAASKAVGVLVRVNECRFLGQPSRSACSPKFEWDFQNPCCKIVDGSKYDQHGHISLQSWMKLFWWIVSDPQVNFILYKCKQCSQYIVFLWQHVHCVRRQKSWKTSPDLTASIFPSRSLRHECTGKHNLSVKTLHTLRPAYGRVLIMQTPAVVYEKNFCVAIQQRTCFVLGFLHYLSRKLWPMHPFLFDLCSKTKLFVVLSITDFFLLLEMAYTN